MMCCPLYRPTIALLDEAVSAMDRRIAEACMQACTDAGIATVCINHGAVVGSSQVLSLQKHIVQS